MLQELWNGIWDALSAVPLKLFAVFADFIVAAIEWLPDPGLADLQTLLGGFGGDVLYFLTLAEFDYGLVAMFGAGLARFTLRRIPFIG